MPQQTLFHASEAEQPEVCPTPTTPVRPAGLPPKLKPIVRDQLVLRAFDLEELVGADHRVRAVWELTGRLDLSPFAEAIVSTEGRAGAAAWDPRLLVCIWVYALSEGIRSARMIERMMEHEPALMWLAGLGVVNHHSLSDFYSRHSTALKSVFAELLVTLEKAQLVDLREMVLDGTKIAAQAGAGTFRSGNTIEKRIQQVEKAIGELVSEDDSGQGRKAVQQRRLEEQKRRLEAALETVQAARQPDKARASISEPEARVMKMGNGGYGPAYNVQVSTDAKAGVVLDAALTQQPDDYQQLMPAIERVGQTVGCKPETVIIDGGYTKRDNIIAAAEAGVELVGPVVDETKQTANAMKSLGIAPEFAPSAFKILQERVALQCPAQKRLNFRGQRRKRGVLYHQYAALASDCGQCEYKPQCCPDTGCRTVGLRQEDSAVQAFRARMQTEASQQVYKKRGRTAEFVNLWIKQKFHMRKFNLRGMAKAGTEVLWAVLTYNMQIWIRHCWNKAAAPAVA